MQRRWPLRLLWLPSHDCSASHDCSTDDCDYDDYNCCADDDHFAQLWKLQRCVGPVRRQDLVWRDLLRLGPHMQQAERVVLSMHPAVSRRM